MSQPQSPPSSDTQTPAPAAAEPGRIYSVAEQRAAILARAGASDLGAFHPHAPTHREPAPNTAVPATEAPGEPVQAAPAPTAPETPATPPSDVTSELTAMRAELAVLQAQAKQPQPAEEPAAPAQPPHPLEAHARNVLGPGAQPHHVQRVVGLLEQDMQWRAYLVHHEANPSDAGPGEQAKAKREIERIQRQIQDLGELASLHAQVAELKTSREQATPEQRKQQRSQFIDGVLVDAQAMAHHPHLARAMESDPTLRDQVKTYLMALPDDESEFVRLGNAYLHQIDALAAKSAPAPSHTPQQPALPQQPRAAQEPPMPKTPQTAPPQPGERYPIRPSTPVAQEQELYSRRDFWQRVNNGVSARFGA